MKKCLCFCMIVMVLFGCIDVKADEQQQNGGNLFSDLWSGFSRWFTDETEAAGAWVDSTVDGAASWGSRTYNDVKSWVDSVLHGESTKSGEDISDQATETQNVWDWLSDVLEIADEIKADIYDSAFDTLGLSKLFSLDTLKTAMTSILHKWGFGDQESSRIIGTIEECAKEKHMELLDAAKIGFAYLLCMDVERFEAVDSLFDMPEAVITESLVSLFECVTPDDVDGAERVIRKLCDLY